MHRLSSQPSCNIRENKRLFQIVCKKSTGELIYHFDFYRINKLSEALDIGTEDSSSTSTGICYQWSYDVCPVVGTWGARIFYALLGMALIACGVWGLISW